MNVEAQVTIDAPRADVWAAIADIANAAGTIRGIEDIEVVHQPQAGLVGLRWLETRILFGDQATVEKWITDAAENEFYTTMADAQGFDYVCTRRISEHGRGVRLTETHRSRPRTFGARLMSIPMGLLFKGVARKAILQDLNDIKAALEPAMKARPATDSPA